MGDLGVVVAEARRDFAPPHTKQVNAANEARRVGITRLVGGFAMGVSGIRSMSGTQRMMGRR